MVILYASVHLPAVGSLWDGVLFILSVMFPMLSVGGYLSFQYPRRRVLLNFEEAPYLVFQLLALGVSSLPFFVLKHGLGSDIACLLYVLVAGVAWFFFVVPRLAAILEKDRDQVLNRSYNSTIVL